MLVLALDIGTSSTRAALFGVHGARHVQTTAQRRYPLHTDTTGKAEIDPAALFDAATACIDECLAKRAALPALADQPIAAVGASCFWHSLVAVDAADRPVSAVITWADSRCRDDAARLRRTLDERATHARTGCMLRASFWPAKLRWLMRAEPGVLRRAARLMSPAEWLYARWCGAATCAHGMATATGLYDPARLAWDPGMLRACRITAERLNPIGDQPARLAGDWARRWPALAESAWIPAIGDGAASNLGAGAVKPGLAAVNFGTTAAVRIVRDRGRPRAPYGLFCYRIDARRFLIGGAISNAGGLRAWCLRELRLEDGEALETELAERTLPEHGLSVLPFWLAERAPTWREDVSGAIVGLTQSTTALDLLQAITEATYQRLAKIVDLVPGAERGLRLIVGGGIQQSSAALQRLADVLGRELIASREPESSLRGAAVRALDALGRPSPAADLGARFRPRPVPARRYRAQRAALAKLEATLFPA